MGWQRIPDVWEPVLWSAKLAPISLSQLEAFLPLPTLELQLVWWLPLMLPPLAAFKLQPMPRLISRLRLKRQPELLSGAAQTPFGPISPEPQQASDHSGSLRTANQFWHTPNFKGITRKHDFDSKEHSVAC